MTVCSALLVQFAQHEGYQPASLRLIKEALKMDPPHQNLQTSSRSHSEGTPGSHLFLTWCTERKHVLCSDPLRRATTSTLVGLFEEVMSGYGQNGSVCFLVVHFLVAWKAEKRFPSVSSYSISIDFGVGVIASSFIF